MLYAVTGILKDGSEDRLAGLQDAFNEHLSQPFRRLRVAGTLCDGSGRKKGFLALIEADTIEQAEAYLRESPVYRADLYERTDVSEYEIQVGAIAGI
ncbi:MAG: hypothetical protein JWO25_501 [Alphaproteobacteria bacterium]|nr:hypothetical protein [Alphaproteobacteria bacterium]MDB5722443.1 hypothetical protein [Alphaproteobacteria bacterium]